jgi:hypothetical protein
MIQLIKRNRLIIGVLILWFFLNCIFLLFSNGNNDAKNYFYPFEEYPEIFLEQNENPFGYTYDLSEFMIYAISPIVLFIVINLIINEKN